MGFFTGQPDETTCTSIPKSAEAGAELTRLEDEREARMLAIEDLHGDLEKQRLSEWRTYGEALKAKIEQLAAETPGLDVAVNITTDTATFRPSPAGSDWEDNSLEGRLLSTALEQTPTPMDLPGTPLERLLGAGSP